MKSALYELFYAECVETFAAPLQNLVFCSGSIFASLV